MTKATCLIDGCEKQAQCRGWCPMHYQRWRIRGDVGSAEQERQKNVGACLVDGCDEPMRKRGWCAGHYAHWRRHGDVNAPFQYTWYGEEITYGHAHKRVRNARGAAAGHKCIDCGGPADEWSYDHTDADERYDDRGIAFSLDTSRYQPRCVRCHRIADGNPIAVRT